MSGPAASATTAAAAQSLKAADNDHKTTFVKLHKSEALQAKVANKIDTDNNTVGLLYTVEYNVREF